MNWQNLLNPRRPRDTTIPSDSRDQFERDFDRSVFSTPVKRLQDKAQVFPLEEHDAVRTRLTHSLEVSSVARGLAARNAKWLLEQGEIDRGMDRSIEAIAATCGLIHDLGNPPFGHAGEDAIRAWFRRSGREKCLQNSLTDEQQIQDFLKFEGNAQSLRLVTKLQILADYHGLNLTFGTLSVLRKYVASSDRADRSSTNRAYKKPGYFASEVDIVERIRNETGTGAARHPICLLVEAADDIAYLTADIEDAVKKGVLSWNKIRENLQPQDDSVNMALERQKKILKAGRACVPSNLDDDMWVTAFRTAAIFVMADGVSREFREQYEQIINGRYRHALLEQSDAAKLAAHLQRIGETLVYPTRSTLTLELMGRRVIGDLMDVFWEGAKAMTGEDDPKTSSFEGKAAALISPNYRQVFQYSVANAQDIPEEYFRFQLVTDYVCGMTDSFAKRLHADLFNGR